MLRLLLVYFSGFQAKRTSFHAVSGDLHHHIVVRLVNGSVVHPRIDPLSEPLLKNVVYMALNRVEIAPVRGLLCSWKFEYGCFEHDTG